MLKPRDLVRKAYHTSCFRRDSAGLKALSRRPSQSTKKSRLGAQSASIALHDYECVVIGLFSQLAEKCCVILFCCVRCDGNCIVIVASNWSSSVLIISALASSVIVDYNRRCSAGIQNSCCTYSK